MIIRIGPKFKEEKEYVLSILLDEILGISYTIEYSENFEGYLFLISNGNEVLIEESSLWVKNYTSPFDYLNVNNIPQRVSGMKVMDYLKQDTIPILFGEAEVRETVNQIVCKADILASSFFMLSRWEEYVVKDRDQHNRFPAKCSLAFKEGFLDRPIVNEYAELLWSFLNSMGFEGKRKDREYNVLVSHDIDDPFFWQRSFILDWKYIASRIIKGFNFKPLFNYLQTLVDKTKDPYYTFPTLISIAKKNNIVPNFYFMVGGATKYDKRYNPTARKIGQLYNLLKGEGCVIGLHPSYDTYNNPDLFSSEVQKFSTAFLQNAHIGRQHYLRFEVPTTWSLWEGAGLQYSNTLTYAQQAGFRCGICQPYQVFDILQRKKLNLVERPLVVMEHSLINYEGLSREDAKLHFTKLNQEVRKYGGEFTFLWHNSFFLDAKKFTVDTKFYEELIHICRA